MRYKFHGFIDTKRLRYSLACATITGHLSVKQLVDPLREFGTDPVGAREICHSRVLKLAAIRRNGAAISVYAYLRYPRCPAVAIRSASLPRGRDARVTRNTGNTLVTTTRSRKVERHQEAAYKVVDARGEHNQSGSVLLPGDWRNFGPIYTY